MRHVGGLRKGHGDEDPPLVDARQAPCQLPRRFVLVEVIARLLQALDALGGRHAAGGDYQEVIAVAPARAGVQGLSGKVEAGDFLHLEVDFRAQQ
ncbi:hypothetical protein D3C79_767450 [compost metagenome]